MDGTAWWEALRRLAHAFARSARTSASEMLVWEHRELENIFAILLLGPAAGIPSPPAPLALALLPELEHELLALFDRAREAGDPLGELFSTFEVT